MARPKLYVEVDWPGTYGSYTYSQTVLRDGPLSYHRFQETGGTTVADTSGNGHTATQFGTATKNQTSPITGESSDRAWALATSGGTNFDVGGRPLGTVEVHVKQTSYSGSVNDQYAIFTNTIVGNPETGTGNKFVVRGDRSLWVQAGDFRAGTAANVVPAAGSWMHMVFIPLTDSVLVYINNTLAATIVDATGVAFNWPSGYLTWGTPYTGALTFPTSNTVQSVSTIDEGAIYESGLQTADIADHYNAIGTSAPPTPSFTDVSTDLRGTLRWTYGATSELGVAEPARLTFQLENKTRKYEPEFAAGGNYPNVIPRRHVRWRLEWPTSTFTTMFDGFVEDWVQEPQGPTGTWATVTAVDGLGVLSTVSLGTRSFVQQKAGARCSRVLDIANWPAATRSLETGVYDILPETVNDETAAAHLLDIGWSENGTFFISKNGTATVWSAIHKTTASRSTTSQATLDDKGVSPKFPYETVELEANANRIINEVTVTKPSGLSFSYADAASRAKYWPQSYSTTLRLAADADVQTRGAAILAAYKDFKMRPVKVAMRPDDSLLTGFWALVVAAERWDRYTIERQPQGTGATISKAVFLEGIEMTVTDIDWEVVWTVSLV